MSRIRQVGLILAIAAFFFGGTMLFGTPESEVTYDLSRLAVTCAENTCTTFYYLQLGNTGKSEQTDVIIRLDRDSLDKKVIEVKAANFGKVPRKIEIEEGEDLTSVHLGRLEAGKRVDLSFALSHPSYEAAPLWDDILMDVTPSAGVSRRGNPEVTRFMRFLYGVLQFF